MQLIILVMTVVIIPLMLIIKPQPISNSQVPLEIKDSVSEILDQIESLATTNGTLSSFEQDDIFQNYSKRLGHDPYNIQALMMRGQYSYVIANTEMGSGYRIAIQDFLKVVEINKDIADPHFGLGTVYYHLAIFDLVKRGRYQIHAKGNIYQNKDTGDIEIKSPVIELFIDPRSEALLQASLNEFQIGKQLKQFYYSGGNGNIMLFAPAAIDERVASLRSILQYEPNWSSDQVLMMAFITFYRKVENTDIKTILEFATPTSP